MSRILTAALFVLTLSAPALADTVPAGATIWQSKPTGAGKPGAVSCYQDVPIGSHIRDMQCALNAHWKLMNERVETAGPETGLPMMPTTP
jgi:hypothetical protein